MFPFYFLFFSLLFFMIFISITCSRNKSLRTKIHDKTESNQENSLINQSNDLISSKVPLNISSDLLIESCHASSLIDTYNDGLNGYPMDIFDNHQFNQLHIPKTKSLTVQDGYNIFNCHSLERFNKNHICSVQTKCPLVKQNIIDAKNAITWDIKHSLCHFHSKLHDAYSTTNIIISGGSVAEGVSTFGCCCDKDVDVKCPINNDPYTCGSQSHKNIKLCRWSGSFERWIKSRSMGKVNVYNIAHGGCNSAYTAGHFNTFFNVTGIEYLTSSDIVFLDFAVNDAAQYDNAGAKLANLEVGLETLVRTVLSRSLPGSWPTIIILEFWPHPDKSGDEGAYDYSILYAKVAKKYQIAIWSYK